jgi:hypothetical protein
MLAAPGWQDTANLVERPDLILHDHGSKQLRHLPCIKHTPVRLACRALPTVFFLRSQLHSKLAFYGKKRNASSWRAMGLRRFFFVVLIAVVPF